MASSFKSPPSAKEASLRTLKAKMNKNNTVLASNDSRGSLPQRMSGPTVDMINSVGNYETNNSNYGPGYSSPSDKLDYRTNGSSRFAVPPSDPIPASVGRNNASRTNLAQHQQLHQHSSGGYSRKDIEDQAAAADKLYQQHQHQQLQQQIQQKQSNQQQQYQQQQYQSHQNEALSRTTPDLPNNKVSYSNQNEANTAFAQSFPGNAVTNSGKLPQQQQQQQLFTQVQQQIQAQPGLAKHRNNSNTSLPSQSQVAIGRLSINKGVDMQRCVEVGLDNLGNTCFMNSTLQCLLHIQPLIQYFLTAHTEQALNLASPQKGVLATSFFHLVQDMYRSNQGNNASISPINFQKAVGTYAPWLMDYQQQDSQEFLRFLLDGMSEDLCRKHSSNTDEDVQPGRSEPMNRVGGTNDPLSPTTGVTPLGTSKSQRSLNTPMTFASNVNNFSGSPYASPGLEDSLSSSVNYANGKAGAAAGKGSILPVLPNNHTHLNVNLSVVTLDDPDSREVPTPTAVTSKMRLVNEVKAARKNKVLSGEIEDEGDLSSVDTQDPSDEELSVSKNEISGNIRNVVENRRSLRVNKSKSTEEDQQHYNVKQSSGEEGSQSSNRVIVRNGIKLNNSTEARPHSPPLQINTALSPVKSPPPATAPAAISRLTPHAESAIAWKRYLKLNDSVITDIFAGQLQSTIECLTCKHRSSSYDPFLDLSVPIHKENESSGTRGFMSAMKNVAGGDNKSTLEKCLTKFTAEEMLEGDNMYQCEKCKTKRKSVKKLSIFKYPKVLVIQIKRFRFNSTSREKLSTDVHFPLSGLDLSSYVSPDINLRRGGGAAGHSSASSGNNGEVHQRPVTVSNNQNDNGESSFRSSSHGRENSSFITHSRSTNDTSTLDHAASGSEIPLPIYDLVGVSNHHGSLHGGHYIAHVDTNTNSRYGTETSDTAPRWMCFNDSRVSNANAASIAGPTAYVLFYKIRE